MVGWSVVGGLVVGGFKKNSTMQIIGHEAYMGILLVILLSLFADFAKSEETSPKIETLSKTITSICSWVIGKS